MAAKRDRSLHLLLLLLVLVGVSFAFAVSPHLASYLALTFDRPFQQSQLAQVAGSGVRFTVDSKGLESLTYNGQAFIPAPGYYDHIVNMALFKAPDGTSKPYGWVSNALADTGFGAATMTAGTPGDDCNSTDTSVTPTCFKHVYRQGQPDSFTVKMAWSTTDSRTAKVDISVTNNDTTDTLNKIAMEYWLGGGAPSGQSSYFYTPDIAPGNSLWWGIGGESATAFIRGTSWGSVAFYTDRYDTNADFHDVWTNSSTGAGVSSPVQFLFALSNYRSPGGAASNEAVDPIAPGQTWRYTLYIRFGSASDSVTTLAPEAFSSYRASFPSLINWNDRRPITRWFIGDGARNSATNPRSYLWDASVDVVPLTPAKQTVFTNRVLTQTDDIITRMNGMNPRPQGIVIWDLEGDEFNHYFTYVGNPNKLADLAPEMDAAADAMFKKFRDAGYKIGVTLRPGDFQTGTSLPATCTSGEPGNVDLDDIFIKTDGTYPNRGYTCISTNTWDNSHARWPYHQHSPQDDATLFANLESKVRYAKNRWNMTLFYVDSTVYSGNGGGNPFNVDIFRRLEREFPDTLFIPENEGAAWWGATAPYNQTNPAVGGGVMDTPQYAKDLYPQAFSVLANFDGINFSDPTTHNTFVQSVKNGNIYMIDAWWDNPTNANILQVYRDAGVTSTPLPPPTTQVPTVSIQAASSITQTSATFNGSIDATGGASIVSRGFNYGPTSSYGTNSVASGSFTTGAYAASVSGLSCGTTYHVQAVATNSVGTGQSSDTTFTTSACTPGMQALTVTKLGSGGGTLVSSPAGISCGSTCSASFANNTVITLSQTANSNSTFVGWGDACSGTGSCTITLSSAQSVSATFNLTPDTSRPSISITAPANNSTVSGAVTLSASASDNVGVAGVQFLVDGAPLGAELSVAPYSGSWNTAGVVNGSHIITAVARDAAGNTQTSNSVAVTVTNSTADTTAPSVPSGLSVVAISASQINITWQSSTDASGVAGYAVYRNGSQIAQVTGLSYSDTGLAAATSYRYEVAAYDAAGNTSARSTAQSATTQNPVNATNAPPSIANGAPHGLLPYTTTAVTISVETNEIATCKYGTESNQPYSSMPNTFSVTNSLKHTSVISTITSGRVYTYYVRCSDGSGNSSTGDYILSFTVLLPNAPTVIPGTTATPGSTHTAPGKPSMVQPNSSPIGSFTPSVRQPTSGRSTSSSSSSVSNSSRTPGAAIQPSGTVPLAHLDLNLSSWNWLFTLTGTYGRYLFTVVGGGNGH